MWAAALTAALLAGSGSTAAAQPSRVVFVSARSNVAQLYSVESSGQGPAQLTFGTNDWGPLLASPNGRLVAAIRDQALWVMRPDGRGARRIAWPAYQISWAANSKRIGYVGGGGIWTVAPTGRARRWVADVTGFLSLSLSPDGRSVAFAIPSSTAVPSPGDLVVARDGGKRAVVAKVSLAVGPAWSPDGKWIAVLSVDGSALELVRPTGGAPRVLARRAGPPYGTTIAWSPDSRFLAYDDSDGIHVVSSSGGDARLLVSGASRGMAWSPEGDAVAFVGKGGPAIATMDGSVRTLFPASPHDEEWWLGIGWTVVRRDDRYRPPETLTPLVEVSKRELHSHLPIGVLAADGDRVAYGLCPHVFGVWRPGDAQQLGEATVEGCQPPRHSAPRPDVFELSLAGDRFAYVTRTGYGDWAFMLTTLGRRTAGAAIVTGTGVYGLSTPPLGDLVGSGSTLVYGAWSATAPESIWRLDGETPVEIAHRPEGLQPLAVDGGRIVARLPDGSLELLDVQGRVLAAFPVPSLAAALAGDDLVVLVRGELRDYSASSGALLHTWPLPDVPSSGPCRRSPCSGFRLRLEGAARGLALYRLDGGVHLLRLRDGADAAFPFALSARLTDAGLFYTFAGVEPWPGGIRFVPFAELPL